MKALLDTSVFIATEAGRLVDDPPEQGSISAMTLAELHLGVLAATSRSDRARRLATLTTVENTFDVLPFDDAVARRFGELVIAAKRRGHRLSTPDAIIAATALAHGATVFTQDDDFIGLPGVRVVKI